MPEDHIYLVLELAHFLSFCFEYIDLFHQSIILLLKCSDEHFSGLITNPSGRRTCGASERTCGRPIHISN